MDQMAYSDPMVGEVVGHVLTKLFYAIGGAGTIGALIVAYFTVRWRRKSNTTKDEAVAEALVQAEAEEKEREDRKIRREATDNKFDELKRRIDSLVVHHNNVDAALTVIDQSGFVKRNKVDELLKESNEACQREVDKVDAQVKGLRRVIDSSHGRGI